MDREPLVIDMTTSKPGRAPPIVGGHREAELLESERRILARLAGDEDQTQVLEEIARTWERHARRYPYCALMVTDESGTELTLAAAPSLPPEFGAVRGKVAVSLAASGCGVAARDKRQILVENLATDPEWRERSRPVLKLGLRAGWAEPVLSARGKLLGVIVVYARQPDRPDAADLALMERIRDLCCIAIEHGEAKRTIERMASHDNLTGLPGRSLLLDHLDRALLRSGADGRATALMLLNLDGMKQVNDALGYELGDRFLKALAQRLIAEPGGPRYVARLGGDEFGIVLEGADDDAAFRDAAHALLECVNRPLEMDGRELFVTASLGAAVGARDGADADQLFKCADAALHNAKRQGRNGFRFYSAELGVAAVRRLALLGELGHALEREQFCIDYQVQRRFTDGAVAGAEALLRWRHPQLGLIAPAEFVPLLEETGLIVPAGEWVLERVCADMVRLERAGFLPPHVSVNLSVRQFHQQDLAGRIAAILGRHGIAAARLTVEITESLLMDDPEKSVRSLRQLKESGVRVAVDDFGTGYSSLSYLKKFPIDELKIDQSFVAGVAGSREDAAIIDATIHMAHNLGIEVVAEGVEDTRQWEFLRGRGCNYAQGYLVGKPSGFDVFLGQLRSGSVEGVIHPETGPVPVPLC